MQKNVPRRRGFAPATPPSKLAATGTIGSPLPDRPSQKMDPRIQTDPLKRGLSIRCLGYAPATPSRLSSAPAAPKRFLERLRREGQASCTVEAAAEAFRFSSEDHSTPCKDARLQAASAPLLRRGASHPFPGVLCSKPDELPHVPSPARRRQGPRRGAAC